MKKSLTKGEMLDLWRNLRMAEPLRLDCAVARTDGTDLSAAIEAETRAWYLQLLDRGDPALIIPVDASPTAIVSSSESGLTLVGVSASSRRILEVRFSGWDAPVAPDTTLEQVRLAAANPYCRRPMVAAIGKDRVAVAGAEGTLSSLMVALDPGPDIYIFDDAALKELIIPPNDL
ncbi:MAG: hypothetical protein K2N10_04420 [Muribaculaceae bacterium]|nr:hypothetical protein [Muribaculaceae bacterium]